LGRKSDGVPQPVVLYINILNHTEDISGTDGPRSGGKLPFAGRSSFLRGAIETRSLKVLSRKL